MKTAAIIPAGGMGRRMGAIRPKQYLPLSGMPVLAHTLKAFQSSLSVDEIILAVPKADLAYVRKKIIEKYGLSKVSFIVPGGEKRQDSVWNALGCVDDETEIVLVHDGVRPFVAAALIEEVIKRAREFGAVVSGVGINDTVKRMDDKDRIAETVSRDFLRLAQTPQAFKREIILKAYRKAYQEGFYGTDDAALVEKTGVPVRLVPGDRNNIKITTKEDLILCEMMLRARQKPRQSGKKR
jgi:2-C-methyl-D-erythritol 4-phosphate cytidylyltransferase